jgi:predicted Zn finger-like uncharacterized protein
VLTQCPNCQTTFRVTSEILRVAHGQVRCGRCQTQFDAIERLVEEAASPTPSGRFVRPSEVPDPRPAPIEVEEPASHEEITLEGRRIEISGTYEVPGMRDPDGEPEMRQEVIEEWIDIEEESEATEPEDPEVPEYDLDEAASEDLPATEVDEAPSPPPPSVPAQPFRRRKTDQPEDELDLLAPKRASAPSARWWKFVVPALALLLAIQILDYFSPTLARHPSIGPALTSLYDKLNLSLTPDWDLHAYKIEQWPIISEPGAPGVLRVRASIANLAPFPQPYPLLRLVLSDRFGAQVRARDLEPREYLDVTSAPERFMTPSQKANVTFTIVDPGQDADGFTFDACLRGRARVVCAEEVPQ